MIASQAQILRGLKVLALLEKRQLQTTSHGGGVASPSTLPAPGSSYIDQSMLTINDISEY